MNVPCQAPPISCSTLTPPVCAVLFWRMCVSWLRATPCCAVLTVQVLAQQAGR